MGLVTSAVIRRMRAVAAVTARPPYVKPGHFYSPLTSDADTQRALTWQGAPGVNLDEAAQIAFAVSARSVLESDAPGPRYQAANSMFGPADAAVYRAVLARLKPSRIIEAGSGYSTAVALDEAGANPDVAGLQITCIEPHPRRLNALLRPGDRVTLLAQPVQDVPPEIFGELGTGDILFIDSSHVAKAGSDVAWLLLHVLPSLAPGVVVHVHDVSWPFTYPAGWLAERRDWNEAYFLHAFLSGNADWKILMFASWLWKKYPGLIPGRLTGQQPGSVWLRKA